MNGNTRIDKDRYRKPTQATRCKEKSRKVSTCTVRKVTDSNAM